MRTFGVFSIVSFQIFISPAISATEINPTGDLRLDMQTMRDLGAVAAALVNDLPVGDEDISRITEVKIDGLHQVIKSAKRLQDHWINLDRQSPVVLASHARNWSSWRLPVGRLFLTGVPLLSIGLYLLRNFSDQTPSGTIMGLAGIAMAVGGGVAVGIGIASDDRAELKLPTFDNFAAGIKLRLLSLRRSRAQIFDQAFVKSFWDNLGPIGILHLGRFRTLGGIETSLVTRCNIMLAGLRETTQTLTAQPTPEFRQLSAMRGAEVLR